MRNNSNDVSFMKGYLQHAIAFEKNVYVWSKAARDVDERVKRLHSERKRIESVKRSATNSLAVLGTSNDILQKSKEQEAVKLKKRSKIALNVMLIVMSFFFLLGCTAGAGLISNLNTKLTLPRWALIPVLGIIYLLIGSLTTGVVPICIAVYVYARCKSANLVKEAKGLENQASQRRREILLRDQEKKAENARIENLNAEPAIIEEQEEIYKQLQIAQTQLRQIYSLDVLPPKYRNLNAVATFYEYLETRRCTTIDGHGGIFDTYETERIQLLQLEELAQMNTTLSSIEDEQRMICEETRQANQTLSNITNQLSEIERTNQTIARNTAISAAANRQTAEAARWMAWNAWANGY